MLFSPLALHSQEDLLDILVADTSLRHAAIAYSVVDIESGEVLLDHEGERNMTPASLLKVVTTAAAIELLGSTYTFTTSIGYKGTIDKSTGTLSGDIVILGGGDPTLGSPRFQEHYGDIIGTWVNAIGEAGIREISGRIVADDSYYDYEPTPSKWPWEDIGNYYGAGVYGISFQDNAYTIAFRTSTEGSHPLVKNVTPEELDLHLENRLIASGSIDRGYIYAAPYSTHGWITGSIPTNRADFRLRGSVTDPPKLLSTILNKNLLESGISTNGLPTSRRLMGEQAVGVYDDIVIINSITSPPLREIIKTMNHESVNLYAEHLLKECGKRSFGYGSSDNGIRAIGQFLTRVGVDIDHLSLVDGSGLSPFNSITVNDITALLRYMSSSGREFSSYFDSFPRAGVDGTLSNKFRGSLFSSVRAKSGTMDGVRGYAGYMTTASGKRVAFCLVINKYYGETPPLQRKIEELIQETIERY